MRPLLLLGLFSLQLMSMPTFAQSPDSDQNWQPKIQDNHMSYPLEQTKQADIGFWSAQLRQLKNQRPSLTNHNLNVEASTSHRVGAFKTYYSSGKLERHGRYDENGQLNGRLSFYHPQGYLAGIDYYEHGVRVGMSQRFYPDGKIKTIFFNQKGQKHGDYFNYAQEGYLALQRHYKQGNLEGEQQTFYPDGQVKTRTFFKQGRREGQFYAWTQHGTLKQEMTYSDGKRDGHAKLYHNNGLIKENSLYRDGKLTGIKRQYYPDGRIYQQQQFNHQGQLIRQFKYASNGEILLDLTHKYQEGQLISSSRFEFSHDVLARYQLVDHHDHINLSETYNPYGQVLERKQFINDKKNGLWISYHTNQDGQPTYIAEQNYQNDKKHGRYQMLSLHGDVIESGQFVNDERLDGQQAKQSSRLSSDIAIL